MSHHQEGGSWHRWRQTLSWLPSALPPDSASPPTPDILPTTEGFPGVLPTDLHTRTPGKISIISMIINVLLYMQSGIL